MSAPRHPVAREALGRFYGMSLDQLSSPDVAQKLLARFLARGELALFLGAGVSVASRLPNWRELVEACEASVGLPSPTGRPTAELMDAMEAVAEKLNDDQSFRNVVRDNLYPADVRASGTYPDSILRQDLLIALGALVMPSTRGSIREVITLNFDDVLEWYLHLHGFRTQSVPEFPAYLRSDVDLVVYHPHGFLPLSGEPSDWLVLTHQEFVRRIAKTDGRPWGELLTATFMTKRLLTIGTSLNDIDIQVYVEAAHRGRPESMPTGFVLDVDVPEAKQRQLKRAGLVPVSLDNHAAIPTFLLGICREAARARTSV